MATISVKIHEQKNTFVFVEVWKDEKAIEKHEETPHIEAFIKELPPLLHEPIRVEKYEANEIS